MNTQRSILVVGAGFSGAVVARELAERLGVKVRVIDSRTHVGGNCHTVRDEGTGVMEHVYGPHIFNTNNKAVWDYVRKFGEFRPFINRVKACTSRGMFSLPINLLTINQFFGLRLRPDEARAFISSKADQSIGEPSNFEEQALKFVGRELYEAFFRGYTMKQWGCDPTELPAAILKRLPVRFNYDDNYYNALYQGIPEEGYTAVIQRILDHPGITVETGVSWHEDMRPEYDHVVYTGPLDAFYHHRHGRVGYRTVYWEKQVHSGDYQGNAVINYTESTPAYTRIHEHKHFAPWESHEKTIVLTEYSKETDSADIPYYPKRLESDLMMLARYRSLAGAEVGISFLGRLATYRYMDMHHVIDEALSFGASLAEAIRTGETRPVFPNDE